VTTRVLRGLDEAVDSLVAVDDSFPDLELRALLSELRLVKDEWEVRQIETAIVATHAGFEDVVRELPGALGPGGERRIESVFLRRARIDGNDAAFDPIVAAGSHATTTLHWTRNDGDLIAGELLLLDAGVESHTLYAADLTRTFPLSGSFSEVQRRALDLLNDAHEAALAAIAPGRSFRDFHHAAAEVVSAGLADWGVLPAAGRSPQSGLYRRFTICGTGHMLGLDVHDCAHARARTYLDGELRAGHVLTVEPGLYFQRDDLTFPEELRGTGVRVEDDVVVTETGVRVLSDRLARRPADVEIRMARLHSE
jgi:Xaa-Pro aminopeptidase